MEQERGERKVQIEQETKKDTVRASVSRLNSLLDLRKKKKRKREKNATSHSKPQVVFSAAAPRG